MVWLSGVVKEDSYNKHLQKWFRKVKKLKLEDILNYNQGDAFFERAGVINGGIGHKVGNDVEPLLMQSLKEQKENVE